MRVLVIDDEEDICEIIAEMAERRGLEVKTLSDTAHTAEVLAAAQPEAPVAGGIAHSRTGGI